jgi:hypothetical protein
MKRPSFSFRWLRVVGLAVLVAACALQAAAEWKEKVLYSFQGGTSDGSGPASGVVFDNAGNLYGVTYSGGSACLAPGCGVVFQIVPPKRKGELWTENLLYEFKGYADGTDPNGGLVLDASGNLYGVTAYGGTGDCVLLGSVVGCGTVYELLPPNQHGGSWTKITLYSFQSGKDGYLPSGSLVFDGAGNLYGSTYFGGGYGTCDAPYYPNCGTIFELSPPGQNKKSWAEKVLYSFKGLGAGEEYGDGANPNGGLVFDTNGAIYGTTSIGGYDCPYSEGQGCGVTFDLTPPAGRARWWGKAILHRFNLQNGAYPSAGVVFGGEGILYGTTMGGGDEGVGVVFELMPPAQGSKLWKEVILHSFRTSGGGENPMASLTLGAEGDLFGTAYRGSFDSVHGSVFTLTAGKSNEEPWNFGLLHAFDNTVDGWAPGAGVTFDSAGNLYSTTVAGGTGKGCNNGCGTVFEVSP